MLERVSLLLLFW